MVVAFHFGRIGVMAAPQGYIAVDFFFALSGFVIAAAYSDRLAGGLTLAKFAEIRLVRLYPMYAIGLLLGLIRPVGALLLHNQIHLGPVEISTAFAFNAFMLPTPFSSSELFPLNGPGWSLFLEVAVNLIFAAFLFRQRKLVLIVVMVAGGLMTIWGAQIAGNLNVGWSWATLAGGAGRTLYSFTLGVLMSRMSLGLRRISCWALILPALLAAVLCIAPPKSLQIPTDLLTAMVVCPLLLAAGAKIEVPIWMRPGAAFLGDLSYPLYAIHFPLIFIFGFAAARVGLVGWPSLLLFLGLAVSTAVMAEKLVDTPLRRWLTARLRARMSPLAFKQISP